MNLFNPCEECVYYPKDYPFCPRSETYVNRRFMVCVEFRKINSTNQKTKLKFANPVNFLEREKKDESML